MGVASVFLQPGKQNEKSQECLSEGVGLKGIVQISISAWPQYRRKGGGSMAGPWGICGRQLKRRFGSYSRETERVERECRMSRAAKLRQLAPRWSSLTLTARQLCDLELLLNGAFSPLTGFMCRGDYDAVCTSMRLSDGTLWPIPMRRCTSRTSGSRIDRLTHTPSELRASFDRLGVTSVVAFQTRNPIHRAHKELTLRAASASSAHLLIHPTVGRTKPGDIDHYTRVRCYRRVLETYPPGCASLSLLPLAMRMAGPREAVLHAIIRRNYGCSHFIVGRDHAGPGQDSSGTPFYPSYAAQDLLRSVEDEVGIEMVPFREMKYLVDEDRYVPEEEVPPGAAVRELSGTELRRLLARGGPIPSWFTFEGVAEELRRTYPPRSRQGFTVFFTGLSGAGKSTIASLLEVKLLERGGRPVTVLDGDVVRQHLSSELGFSKAHRDLNIRRIGYVAAEITKHGGIAICAPIAPYESVREQVREAVESAGGFLVVYVSTSLEECERRDTKGLYAKARAGLVPQFTGVSDP